MKITAKPGTQLETIFKQFYEQMENGKNQVFKTVEDEMSDACIRLFDDAGLKNIDLDDYDYKGSDTEDYTELTFTESMFCIIKYITDGFYQYEPQIILNEIFAFCKSRNIAIMWHIKKKMMFNTLREYRHGKKAY